MLSAFDAGYAAFAARDFATAQEAWAPLVENKVDLPLAFLSEYRYVQGDHEGALELAQRRSMAGTTRPSPSVQYARAVIFTKGPEEPIVVPILTRAEEFGDPDAAAWLAEALDGVGDVGAAGRLWRKAAQQGSVLGIRRTIEHLKAVDPEHPEIAGWHAIAAQKGLGLDAPAGGSAFGQRDYPETPLTRFIRGAGELDPNAYETARGQLQDR